MRSKLPLIIVLIVFIGIGFLWYATEQQKKKILSAGQNTRKQDSTHVIYSNKGVN
jgi:hypothetical protein